MSVYYSSRSLCVIPCLLLCPCLPLSPSSLSLSLSLLCYTCLHYSLSPTSAFSPSGLLISLRPRLSLSIYPAGGIVARWRLATRCVLTYSCRFLAYAGVLTLRDIVRGAISAACRAVCLPRFSYDASVITRLCAGVPCWPFALLVTLIFSALYRAARRITRCRCFSSHVSNAMLRTCCGALTRAFRRSRCSCRFNGVLPDIFCSFRFRAY